MHIVAHQLRAPLANINGFLDLLQTDNDSMGKEEKHGIIDRIKENTDQLSSLFKVFLSTSTLEFGGISVQNSEFTISSIMEELLQKYESLIKEKNIAIELHISPDDEVFSDKVIIIEIIDNLLSNSLKYSHQDGKVIVNFIKKEVNEFSIQDFGIGIPQEEKQKIGEKLYRASNSKDDFKGTGLGLYSVNKLLTYIHANMHFHSVEHTETIFTLRFPDQREIKYQPRD